MSDKDDYRNLCSVDSTIPIFLQDWWLDAVCGASSWDVALIHKNGSIQAALPYMLERRFGLVAIGQPKLTQFLGPWFSREVSSGHSSRQRKLMLGLLDKLPHYDIYRQSWAPSVTDWLPFYWRGASQTTWYTNVIEDLSDEGHLWAQLRPHARRAIRKATDKFGLEVCSDGTLEDMVRLNQLTFSRQGLVQPYPAELVSNLDSACADRGCRQIFIARDQSGRPHAGIYIVWDHQSAYYLLGGGDPELRCSGATSLCFWEAIRHSAGVTQRFDFEGSMIEPIEHFFRSFGGTQTPYFRVEHDRSRVARWAKIFLRVMRAHR